MKIEKIISEKINWKKRVKNEKVEEEYIAEIMIKMQTMKNCFVAKCSEFIIFLSQINGGIIKNSSERMIWKFLFLSRKVKENAMKIRIKAQIDPSLIERMETF